MNPKIHQRTPIDNMDRMMGWSSRPIAIPANLARTHEHGRSGGTATVLPRPPLVDRWRNHA